MNITSLWMISLFGYVKLGWTVLHRGQWWWWCYFSAVLEDTVTRSSMNLSDVADNVQGDWVILAQQLGVTMSDINRIKTDYSTLADQALAMLQLWVEKSKEKATGKSVGCLPFFTVPHCTQNSWEQQVWVCFMYHCQLWITYREEQEQSNWWVCNMVVLYGSLQYKSMEETTGVWVWYVYCCLW